MRRSDPASQVVPGIGPEKLETLLTIAMRNESIFESVKGILDSACFTPAENVFAAPWLNFVKVSERYGRMLSSTQPVILDMCDMWHSSQSIPRIMLDEMVNFLRRVDATPVEFATSDIMDRFARDELRLFIAERAGFAPLRKELNDTSRLMRSDPQAVLDRLQQRLAKADTLLQRPSYGILPQGRIDGIIQSLKPSLSSGIKKFDDAMGGGMRNRCVYGLFGPFGSYKTGTAVQMAVQVARAETSRQRSRHTQGYQAGLVIYAVYEGGRDAIQVRACSTAACIPRSSVTNHFINDETRVPLSSVPLSYEREYGLEGTEIERLTRAGEEIEPLRIIDLSNSHESRNQGTGYVPELVASIEHEVRMSGNRPVAAVFIDYAKIMARRYAMATGKTDQLVHLISTLPDQLRIQIAEQFDCPVWILQQLDAEANKAKPGAALHHSQSSWAKDFGENLWYAFCLSSIDKVNSNTITVNVSKTRDSEGMPLPFIMQLNGHISQLRDTDEYRYNPGGNKIVPVNVDDMFNDADIQRRRNVFADE
jgi:RecA/RadA recombinase